MKRSLSIAAKVLGALTVLVLIAGAALAYLYNSKIDSALSTVKSEDLIESPKPTPTASHTETPASAGPMNVLLLGSDSRGTTDRGRSDSIMVAHIPADRRSVYLISLPRDLYVEIPGHDPNKINAAYSFGGTKLTAKTVEALLGITIDHAAIVDFKGFINLVDSMGGVTIDNPHTGCDETAKQYCWKKGKVTLTKNEALRYVRWRHGLPNGDIDRAANQQRVLKAVIRKLISGETLTNPDRFGESLSVVTSNVVVDSELTPDRIKELAFGMRITGGDSIRSFTFPISGFRSNERVGSYDVVDEARAAELRAALKTDSLDEYWSKHKDSPLPGSTISSGK